MSSVPRLPPDDLVALVLARRHARELKRLAGTVLAGRDRQGALPSLLGIDLTTAGLRLSVVSSITATAIRIASVEDRARPLRPSPRGAPGTGARRCGLEYRLLDPVYSLRRVRPRGGAAGATVVFRLRFRMTAGGRDGGARSRSGCSSCSARARAQGRGARAAAS